MAAAHLKLERAGGALKVVLSRPDVRNAFDAQTIAEITAAFASLQPGGANASARLVLLSGEGPAFCSGADLSYMRSLAQFSHEENRADADRLFAMFEAVRSCPVPVLAHVHGHVVGGGLGLTACADIALADSETAFRFSEVRLGILPAVISPFVLARMQPGWARRYMLTGEEFLADEALTAGLVQFVGTREEIGEETERLVRTLSEAGPSAVRATKTLLRDIGGRDPLSVRALVTEAIAAQRTSVEGQEGMGAFLSKRPPSWRQS